MKDVIDLLKEQNKLTLDHNSMVKESLQEFIRLLKLQSAESRLGNARRDIMDDTLQKLLKELQKLGVVSEELLKELSR